MIYIYILFKQCTYFALVSRVSFIIIYILYIGKSNTTVIVNVGNVPETYFDKHQHTHGLQAQKITTLELALMYGLGCGYYFMD